MTISHAKVPSVLSLATGLLLALLPSEPVLAKPLAARPHGLRALSRGHRKLADFVDARRGVLVVTATDFPQKELPTRAVEHLCGAELRRSLPDLEKQFRKTITGERPSCSQRDCYTPGWEHGPMTHYVFEREGNRLLLQAILSKGVTLPHLAEQERYIDRAWKRWKTRLRCPEAPTRTSASRSRSSSSS